MSFGIPAESDMFYEDGVLRSTTTARTYGGISRAAQPLLTSGKPKVLEPTSIDKATPEWRFGVDYASFRLHFDRDHLRGSTDFLLLARGSCTVLLRGLRTRTLLSLR